MHNISALLNHYGYIVLFIALIFELIAVPLPGEVLMTYCGFLVYQRKMNLGISVIVAALGAIGGITISYGVGLTLGVAFLNRYGHYIHLGPKRMEQASKWFERYGSNLLIIAYFIPGVRHITGYFSGVSKANFRNFALKGYLGAFIWAGTFISLGNILGPNWSKFHYYIKKYLIVGGIILSCIIIVIYFYRNHKLQIIEDIRWLLNKGLNIFHSIVKTKVAVVGITLVFLGLTTFVIALIQDYLAHEFVQFDAIVDFLVKLTFAEQGSDLMNLFGGMGTFKILIPFSISVSILILVKGENKWLEVKFFAAVILGGELLSRELRYIFHRVGPIGSYSIGSIKYTFPSEQVLMAVIVYGFAAFIIIRHLKIISIGTIISFIALVICIFIGISCIYFQVSYPSDVIAGYAFGGVWLTLNMVVLEIFRMIPEINYK